MSLTPFRGTVLDLPPPIAQVPGQYLWPDGTIRDALNLPANILFASVPELVHTNVLSSLIYKVSSITSGAFALSTANNLSDVASPATARTNLGVPAGSGTSTGTNTGDTSNSDGTITVASGQVLSLNLAHANTWTGAATFNSSTLTAGVSVTTPLVTGSTYSLGSNGLSLTPAAQSSGTPSILSMTGGAHTGITASTECPGVVYTPGTKQWAAGALALQRETYLPGVTVAFASGSNAVTELDTLYVKAGAAGTNCSGITNNNAIVSEGNLTLRRLGFTTNDVVFFNDGNTNAPLISCGSTSVQIDLINGFFRLTGFAGAGKCYICNSAISFNNDTCLYRIAASVIGVGNAANSGSGWLQNSAGRARASAGDATNATATMANIDGTNLKITLIAGRKYAGKLTIYANNSTGAEGLQFDFNGGTATATTFQAGFVSTPLGATVGNGNTTALGTALTVTAVPTTDDTYVIEFTFICNAAGTLIPRFAEVSHTLGTATVRATTVMLIEDMPT